MADALFATLMLCALGGAQAAPADRPVAITPDNFVRAESDLYFSGVVKDGGFGKFMHRREPTPIAKQTVIRMNRDTLYSAAVFDLDAGPATITLPDPGERFLSMHKLNVKDVPVDGFWSISVYHSKGYFAPNPENAYSLNNLTAKAGDDGSFAIQFGGCDGKIANCLPVPPGWNYLVRLYRPKAEVLNGAWTFPEPQPAR